MDLIRLQYPLVIGHRGDSSRCPENTLIAFEKAIQSNVPMIEFDVTLTRDRKVVVIHDETLGRTTSGRGRVADHSLAELKGLDAGSWFSKRFSGETIPTLAEALAAIDGRTAVNIEIKPEAVEAHHPEDAIERQILRLLKRRGGWGDILVSSFDIQVLAELARTPSPPALGYLTDGGDDDTILDACQSIDAFSWNAHYRNLTRLRIGKAHTLGLRVFAYTVNAPRDMAALFRMGVDGIFTDDPETARTTLSAMQFF